MAASLPHLVLEARIAQLQQEIDAALDDAAQVSEALGRHGDAADASVADDQATADFADARRDLEELHACEAALRRLAQGVYGQCIDCGLEIDPARLRARPAVARCLVCQQRLERDQRTPHPRL
jgi:DnaK suppressor protein